MDASQYKDYVLVILFVKYISDKSRNDSGFDIEIPEGCFFEDFVALKGSPNIGEEMNKKTAALAEANQLDGVFIADFDDAQAGDVVGIYWQPNDYAINENFGFTMRRYFDEEMNEWVDKALVVVDGKVLNPTGFYKIIKG
jgi:type I restriction enzyme M protein